MSKFTPASGAHFGRFGLSEAVAEMSLALAAAAVKAPIWQAVGPMAFVAGRPAANNHDGTPVTTTAQNTAANPITLR